jgi:polygalacturonase
VKVCKVLSALTVVACGAFFGQSAIADVTIRYNEYSESPTIGRGAGTSTDPKNPGFNVPYGLSLCRPDAACGRYMQLTTGTHQVTVQNANGTSNAASFTVTGGNVTTTANVKDFGAVGNGVADDTAAIQAALTAVPVAGGTVFFPPGTYLTSSTLLTKSNTTILGSGPYASIIKAKSTMLPYAPLTAVFGVDVWATLTNATYSWGGNSNVVVLDLGFDMTEFTSIGGTFNIHFRNMHGSLVKNVYTLGGNDGIAHTRSTNFVVTKCQTTDAGNAGIDQWDHSSDGTIVNNRVIANRVNSPYGILATGVGTTNIKVTDNYVNGITHVGIWIQGGGAAGGVTNSVVQGNTVKNITKFFGIRVSDADNISIVGNTIASTGNAAINFMTEAIAGVTHSFVTGNVISGVGAGASAILINNASAYNVLDGNTISGSAYAYGIELGVGTDSNQVENNVFATGTSGRILNLGGA